MGVHTWMDSTKLQDSVTGRAINPRLNPEKDDDGGESAGFGDNPGWDKGWVKAYRINMMGQVLNILFFVVFNYYIGLSPFLYYTTIRK